MIFSQFSLRDMAGLGNDSVGMADSDAGRYQSARFVSLGHARCGNSGHGFLLFHISGILVLAKSLKRGMADASVRGPFSEGDFAEQFGFDPMHGAPFAGAHAFCLVARQDRLWPIRVYVGAPPVQARFSS